MKTNQKTITLMATALLLTACQQADEPQTVPTDGVPLRLTSGISTIQTRAFDSSWENTDEIGVFAVKMGKTTAYDITTSGTNRDENIRYKISAEAFTGTATSIETYNNSKRIYSYKDFEYQGNQIYMPADGSEIDVYAYYPWTLNVTASDPLRITVPTTQTVANQKNIDVMKACALSSTSSINIDHATAQLLFNHIMSKVLVRVVVGEGYGASDLIGSKISKVELTGQPTTATFAPITQTMAITNSADNTIQMCELLSGDPDYVTSVSLTEDASATPQAVIHNYRAIVLPNMESTNPVTSGTQRQINFTVGSITYSYNIKQNLQPGYQTVYTIVLAANEVVVTAAITPWTTNDITPEKPLLPNT